MTCKATKKIVKNKLKKIVERRRNLKRAHKSLKFCNSSRSECNATVKNRVEKAVEDNPPKRRSVAEESICTNQCLEKDFFGELELSESSDVDRDSEGASGGESDSETVEEVKRHQRDLQLLAQDKSQSEFFEYLKEQDPNLLNFEDGDEDGLLDDSSHETSVGGHPVLTAELFESWKEGAFSKNFKSFKCIYGAYGVAANMNGLVEEGGSNIAAHFQYDIKDYAIFNNVLVFVLKNTGELFKIFLADKGDVPGCENGGGAAEFGKKNRSKISSIVFGFWSDTLNLLNHLVEPKMLYFVMKSLENCVKYLTNYEKMQKKLLKKLLELWSTNADNSVRIMAFLLIHKMCLDIPYPFICLCLKSIYLTFVSNSKFYNAHSQPLIEFMKNCVVEIYGLDVYSSYQHAFVYIREIASHLRNAYYDVKKNYSNIFNFQFLNSVRVWVCILCRYGDSKHFSLLFYPLIQLVQGIIAIYKSATVYPMRLHCAKMLNDLARSSKSFVNSAANLLEILSSPDLIDPPKKSDSNTRVSVTFNVIVPKSAIRTQAFQNSIFQETVKLLAEYLVINAKSVAFPELSYKVMNVLTKFRKSCRNSRFCNEIRRLQKSLLLTCQMIRAKRSDLTLSVGEMDNLATCFDRDDEFVTPIEKYYKDYLELLGASKRTAQKRNATQTSANDHEDDECPFSESESH